HQRTGVESLNANNAMCFEIGAKTLLRPPVALSLPILLYNETFEEGSARFNVFWIHTDVANLRVRHRHDLPFVRWVRQDFLITGERGIEDDFTCRLAFGAKRGP